MIREKEKPRPWHGAWLQKANKHAKDMRKRA